MGTPAVGVALVVALVAAGLAWHECLLLVTAALAAQRFEWWRIERTGPLDAWRIGARCLVAGGSFLLGAMALGGVLLAALAGWWQPSHDHPIITVGLIAAAGAAITAVQPSLDRFFAEAGLWLVLVLAATASLLAVSNSGIAWACVASGTGITWLGWSAWQLAGSGASLLRSN